MAARALGKNIQYQVGTIQHAAIEQPLQIALLGGAQFMIENDQRNFALPAGGGNFLHLPGTCEGAGIRPGAPAANDCTYLYARAFGEQLEFFQTLFVIRVIQVQANENRLAAALGAIKHQASASGAS